MQSRYSKPFRPTRLLETEARVHKMSVGTFVTLLVGARDPRSKDQRLETEAAKFEITRLLPSEGAHWQSRRSTSVMRGVGARLTCFARGEQPRTHGLTHI